MKTRYAAVPACLVLLLALFLAPDGARGQKPFHVSLADPTGDDKGPGSYTYPTDPVYLPGSFDLTAFEMIDQGEMIEIRVSVNQKIGDPWKSATWPGGGNGFSLQHAQVYIDMDHKAGSGILKSLPGLNVVFEPESAWEKVVVLSPNTKGRIIGEARYKAKDLLDRIVIPQKTWAEGKTIFALVPKSDLGEPKPSWGFQVVCQSNEGIPDQDDFLVRKIDRAAGPHHFGGSDGSACAPHVIDILAPPARGTPDEIWKQNAILSSRSCGTGTQAAKLAALPMIYPLDAGASRLY